MEVDRSDILPKSKLKTFSGRDDDGNEGSGGDHLYECVYKVSYYIRTMPCNIDLVFLKLFRKLHEEASFHNGYYICN